MGASLHSGRSRGKVHAIAATTPRSTGTNRQESDAHAPIRPEPSRRFHRRTRRGARRAAGVAGERSAEVLLRPPRLAPVRGDHRAARVLPDAHRGVDLRAPRGRPGARGRLRHHVDRPRCRQLREGDAAVPAARAAPLRRGRHLGRLPARRAAPGAARASGDRNRRPRPRLLAPARAAGRHRRRPAGVLLSRLEHRQFRARRSAAVPAPRPRSGGGRRPGDRRRSGEAQPRSSRRRTTTRSASPRRST